jgi:uncharacterized membrane protein YcaP (DUF421 family)
MYAIRIALRAVFAYVFLLVMLRLSGKRVIGHLSTVEFVLALVFGDLIDDAIWAEVPIVQFVMASATIFLSHLVLVNSKARVSSLSS